jgi:hypothetical protein
MQHWVITKDGFLSHSLPCRRLGNKSLPYWACMCLEGRQRAERQGRAIGRCKLEQSQSQL